MKYILTPKNESQCMNCFEVVEGDKAAALKKAREMAAGLQAQLPQCSITVAIQTEKENEERGAEENRYFVNPEGEIFDTEIGDEVQDIESNPRFVWVVGAIRERFPDISERVGCAGSLILWDRQEKRACVTVDSNYAQAMVLEVTTKDYGQPFTKLEKWFNVIDNESLKSEGLKPTKKEFHI